MEGRSAGNGPNIYVVELGEDRTPDRLEKWRPLREELLAFTAQLRGELEERHGILRWI